MIRTYLETVLELPWNKMTKDNASLKHAEEILEPTIMVWKRSKSACWNTWQSAS